MKVLLVDDHPIFLDGLRNLLTSRGVEVIGVAQDGFEALEQARILRPEVILMDIRMPRLDGLAATRLIKAELPNIQIVMLTISGEDKDLFEAVKSGAFGYLLKTQDTEEFFRRLYGIAQGEPPLSPGLAARILKEFGKQERTEPRGDGSDAERATLSDRQREVLELVGQGLTYREVGVQLHLTERTVKYHMREIIHQLHLENHKQVMEYARAHRVL